MSAVPEIGPEDAERQRVEGARLLDVRTSEEWNAGHVADSVWIPITELPDRIEELDDDEPVVVVCRTGARSAAATAALLRAGYDAVNLAGGLQAWAAAGQPVVTTAGSPGTVA